MDLTELGATIRRTRIDSGISQLDLAGMSHLSRVTVNYAERGRVAVGADALLRILQPLGLSIGGPQIPNQNAVGLLAKSASVSFRSELPATELERAFVTGRVDDQWLPHFSTLIDEATDAMLLRGVREVADRFEIPATTIWRNLKRLAATIASPNPRWRHGNLLSGH